MSTTAKTTARTTAKVTVKLGADLSPAVKALETAYRQIQRRYPDAPNVTIVVKRDMVAWGHTTVAQVWAPRAGTKAGQPVKADRFEIMISGENLARGAEAVAGTLLHEAAHARNLARGILDTDVNGRHNAKFKTAAEEHGLTVTGEGWRGYNSTSLDAAGQATWQVLVATIARGLEKSAQTAEAHLDHLGTDAVKGLVPVGPGKRTKGTPAPVAGPRRRGDRNLAKATCGCGDSIRASRGVLERCRPTCQVCGQEYVAA